MGLTGPAAATVGTVSDVYTASTDRRHNVAPLDPAEVWNPAGELHAVRQGHHLTACRRQVADLFSFPEHPWGRAHPALRSDVCNSQHP